jgi:hypothetical protein
VNCGLRGVGVDVRLIGGCTRSKPCGFCARDTFGIPCVPIECKGVNAQGFGDYLDGFDPVVYNSGASVTGCGSGDDMDHELGDPSEAMLATALGCRISGSNPSCGKLWQPQSAVRENRIVPPRRYSVNRRSSPFTVTRCPGLLVSLSTPLMRRCKRSLLRARQISRSAIQGWRFTKLARA